MVTESDRQNFSRKFLAACTFGRPVLAGVVLFAAIVATGIVFFNRGDGKSPEKAQNSWPDDSLNFPGTLIDDPRKCRELSSGRVDPGGFPPPDGVVVTASSRLESYKTQAQRGEYETELSLEDVVGYYRTKLVAGGFKEISDRTSSEYRMLTFVKTDMQFTLKLLPKRQEKERMSRYVAICCRYEQ